MTNDIEAVGALATAGLAASEVDRRWWRREVAVANDTAPGICANCETALIGAYCHACGQSRQVHRSVGHVFEEFLHGVWHFDSKAWRTLPLLAFRPGRLTWDYIHGKRARFIAPLALFLFSIFLMFFVFGFVGAPDFGNAVAQGSKIATVAGAREAVTGIKSDIARIESSAAEAQRQGDAKAADDARRNLAVTRIALRIAEANVQRVAAATGAKSVAAVPAKSWTEQIAEAARAGRININSGIPGANENIRKALQNPEFALYRIQQKAYKLSFLLIPLSLPVLWLMFFWRRDTTIYDHVVFTLYSLSFMSLLLVLAVLLIKAMGALEIMGGPARSGIAALLLVPPVHMFFQLKGGYRLSIWGALWRTAVLSQATVIILGLFATLIVVVGLAD